MKELQLYHVPTFCIHVTEGMFDPCILSFPFLVKALSKWLKVVISILHVFPIIYKHIT